jgi:hypothetical protein
MPARTFAALPAFILAGLVQLHGQDQPASVNAEAPISTDRPAVTNSSVVVPAGSLQVENGFLETSSQGQSVLDGPESLVRFGVAKRTELRFTVPDYFHTLATSNGSSNVKDGGSSLGPTVAVEVTPIKNWLGLEAGVTPLSLVTRQNGTPTFCSRSLGRSRKKQSSCLALVRRGFIRRNTP